MKRKDLFSRVPVGVIYLIAIVLMAFATIGSCLALWSVVGAEPRMVRLEGTDAPRVVDVGKIPDTLARDFAVDFLVTFETYSPETVERAAAFSRSRVAPQVLPNFTKLLANRKDLVRESGMVSQILIEDREDARVIRSAESPIIEVVVTAHRRIYIAGRLTEGARLIYRIGIEPAQPTRDNPTGLFITGQSVKVVSEKANRRER